MLLSSPSRLPNTPTLPEAGADLLERWCRGEIPRTLLLGPATQLESQYADGVIDEEEEELRFPVPEFTPVGGKGTPRDIEPLPTFPTS